MTNAKRILLATAVALATAAALGMAVAAAAPAIAGENLNHSEPLTAR